jgi:SRSO17 transposase
MQQLVGWGAEDSWRIREGFDGFLAREPVAPPQRANPESRKNCDTIAAAVADTDPERLQHLLTDAEWEASALDEARVRHLAGVSPPAGVLLIDDTGLPKQGRASPGVARQYCGTLGKVGNCQIVVTAEYVVDVPSATQPLHWPVAARVYLPASWAQDPTRRRRARIADTTAFATKSELALELVDCARAWGVAFGVVVADANYGSNPHFLAGLEERGLGYVVAVDKRFGVRAPDAVAVVASAPAPAYRGVGRPRKKRPADVHVAEEIAAHLTDADYTAVTWRDGTAGPLCKQVAACRMHRAAGPPTTTSPRRIRTGPQGWFLVERPLPGESGDTSYYLSNLGADVSRDRLVQLAHARWAIEQFYEDAKGECGLDDYQGRRWDGLHRHLALVLLAYSFLMIDRHTEDGVPVLSPLRNWPVVPRRPPPRFGPSPARPRPVVRAHRPDSTLPAQKKLTQ